MRACNAPKARVERVPFGTAGDRYLWSVHSQKTGENTPCSSEGYSSCQHGYDLMDLDAGPFNASLTMTNF